LEEDEAGSNIAALRWPVCVVNEDDADDDEEQLLMSFKART
jgi:hypothetical protein